MSLEQGFTIIDGALDLATDHLEKQGLPKDEAQIALLIRLRNVVSPEVAKMAEILTNDVELEAAINRQVAFEERPSSNY